jgi:rhodanese-related sulfurtransferase
MLKFGSMLAVMLLALSVSVMADDKVADISHEDLVKAIKDKKVVLIDCNGSESFKKGHIPGALDFETNKDVTKVLPTDKGALVVAYCGSEKCPAYKAGAEAALKAGYTNVKHYAGGLAGWTKSGEKLETAEAPAKTDDAKGEAK